MISRNLSSRDKQPFTWFTIVGTLDQTLKLIQGFYDNLVDTYKKANKMGDTSSPFYGWELKKENIEVYVTFGLDGLSIFLYPRFAHNDYFEGSLGDFGESWYLATVQDVGGSPAYLELVKVIEYLLRPIRDKVGQVDDSEIKDYCHGGRGYIVLTEEESRYKPLKEVTT